ncbi:hypothetical protein [Sinorhizobium terangae]|uniref:hypothetical protein n=1 Tax=Sinorhizobium terangae TaxID=110322 RepID=UPI0024B05D7C|nr:hypothetical protein [Sinorhizobium terangae]WFU51784.1 hypothetical protein QA637_30445 [Sinorhizobium terangae]
MQFREVPWKRNLRKVPEDILSKIRQLDTDAFIVGTVKTISASDVVGRFNHLSPPGELDEPSELLPPKDMGPYSTRNIEGWEVKRTDLPKITKTFYWETPNFGDAATYGTHLHFHDREVYRREFHQPRLYEISTKLLKMATGFGGGGVYQIAIKQPLLRTQKGYEEELFFMLNLLQENCGSVGIFNADASREEIISTLSLDWEIFPPGSNDEIVHRLTAGRKQDARKVGVVAERVKLFSLLKPTAFLRGNGAFGSYIGARYADDLVVFENMEYGNALYILYDDWQEISKRSRLDLIRGTDAEFDRLPHTYGWEQAFGRIMRREKKKRGLV